MRNFASRETIRQELIMMCEGFVSGDTLANLSRSTRIALNTLRSRRVLLVRIDVRLKVFVIKGRGFRTPCYTLDEPIDSAIEKIDAKYTVPKEKKAGRKKKYERDDSIRAGRHGGYGIESWLFIDPYLSQGYLEWCDSWTVQGQKLKDKYGEK